MSNLQVGQKVTRVRDTPWWSNMGLPMPPNLPQFNVVYTVRAVLIDKENQVCILLEEIRNEPYPPCTKEQTFFARCFRPVVERKTDISIFQAMLTPKQVPLEVA